MSAFQWDGKKQVVAVGLAEGFTQLELAKAHNIADRTIRRWLKDVEFSSEVDRLSLMIGIAHRAERLRIANRVVRQRVNNDLIQSDKDLLDWLKFAQSETDGAKSELATSLADLIVSVAQRSGGESQES